MKHLDQHGRLKIFPAMLSDPGKRVGGFALAKDEDKDRRCSDCIDDHVAVRKERVYTSSDLT